MNWLLMTNWQELSIYEQMANVGSEVQRLFTWQERGKPEMATRAAERAVDLVEKTMADQKNQRYRKELQKLKQLIVEFSGQSGEAPNTRPATLKKYFLSYGLAVRS